MNKFKQFAAIICFVLFSVAVQAQDTAENGIMKSNGKIYVVMAVVIVIVIGLFLYVFNLDRKISKLEKE
jgi:CcmD family protein